MGYNKTIPSRRFCTAQGTIRSEPSWITEVIGQGACCWKTFHGSSFRDHGSSHVTFHFSLFLWRGKQPRHSHTRSLFLLKTKPKPTNQQMQVKKFIHFWKQNHSEKMRRIWNLLSKSKQLLLFSSPASKFRLIALRSYCDEPYRQNRAG